MQIDVLNNAEVYRMKTIFYDIKSKKRWFSGETYYEECKERTCDYTLRNGKVIDKEAIDFENNKMIKSERYEFVNGLVTKQQIVIPGGFLEEETLFSYDDNEHLLMEETYKNGVLSNRILYKYNNIGKITSETVFKYKDGRISKTAKEWIYEGRKATVIYYYTKKTKTEYEYNSMDRLIKEIRYSPEGEKIMQIDYIYDSDGRLSRKIYDRQYVDEFQHDRYGNLTLYKCYHNYGLTFLPWNERSEVIYLRDEYRYDTRGNWVENKHFVNNTYTSRMTREIKYL